MKKQHLYLKFNLTFFLNDRIYSLFTVFYKSLEVLKRDIYFYKLWNYIKLESIQKNFYLLNFLSKYGSNFLN